MNIKELGIQHVAIIMDGNGRWATEKNLDRTAGHAAGEHALSKAIYWALENNLSWLTVYAFSTENWTRSSEEVDFLMFFNRDILISIIRDQVKKFSFFFVTCSKKFLYRYC